MARDGVTVRAALGPPQRPVKRLLDDLRHGMFEALRFGIRRNPVEPEYVRQPALHDPGSPDDAGCCGLPAAGQLDLFTGIESQHPIPGPPPKRYSTSRPANGNPVA